MSEYYFPREILVEILSWLPSKSLLKFRCVCKSWNSLITNPSFISLHRHRFSQSQSFLLFQLYMFNGSLSPEDVHCSLRRNDPFLSDSGFSLSLPHSSFRPFSIVVGICHGLLCISDGDDCSSLVICNPSIRRFLSLPEPFCHNRIHSITVAFGFDSRNCDYKIVRVTKICHLSILKVEVYSLASGIWRSLPEGVAPSCTLSWAGQRNSHAFVNGLVHWGARRRVENHNWYLFLLSFDFVDEVFDEIALPESLAHASSHMATINVVGGGNQKALTVYHLSGDMPCVGSIWVMKEYGVVQSWNKVFNFDLIDSCLLAPSLGITVTNVPRDRPPTALCVTNNGEILLLLYNRFQGKGRLYLLDVEKKGFVDLQFEAKSWGWRSLYTDYYAETLVLMDKAGDLMSY